MRIRYECILGPALAAVLVLAAPPPAAAGWPGGPDVNVAACTAPNDQGLLQIAPDGQGGVILAWADSRPGAPGIYVQRVTAFGTPAWTADGVRIYTPPDGYVVVGRRPMTSPEEVNLGIVPDGSGGAIVVWKDTVGTGETSILAQRVGRTGQVLWGPAGVPVCDAPGWQNAPTAVSDGAGGAIVAWEDLRDGALTVRAQRVSESGGCAWTPGGVLASSASEGYQQPNWYWSYLASASDEAGGAILTWASARGIVAQRLDPGGAPLWSAAGVAVRPHERAESQPHVVCDGAQGAFVTWTDYWNGGSGIYAQRVGATGVVQWSGRGVAVCDGWFDSWAAHLVRDGQGGALLVWEDTRPYYCGPCNGSVLYAQRLDGSGNARWAASGVLVSDPTRGSNQVDRRTNLQVVADGSGGAFLTYALNVSGDPDFTSGSVYLQRVNPDGTRAWASDVRLTSLAANQAYPVLVASQPGGALIAWEDLRNGNRDLYTQRVAADGTFRAPVTFTDAGAGLPAVPYGGWAWGDYDNDGDLDLLCARGSDSYPHVYRNDGGNFVDSGISLPWCPSFNAIWGDFDNDGWLDIGVSGAVYRNNRDGTFSVLFAHTLYPAMGLVSCADYDADGDLDLLCDGFLAGYPHEPPRTYLYRNDGNGSFALLSVGIENAPFSTLSWADYDRDGHIDLLLGGQLYHNKGNASFLHVQAGLPDDMYSSGAWGDYDNDGWPDVAVARYGVYRNNHDGTFDRVSDLPTSWPIAWVDFDNDGRSDILLHGDHSTIYRNEGGGLFTDIGAALPAAYSPTSAVADFDRDGDADLLLDGLLYRSDGAPANTPPGVPDGPWSNDVSNGYITLQWSPTTDAETPASALTYNLRIGTTPGGNEIMSPMSDPASGFRRVVQTGDAGTCTSLTIKVPYSQERVYWSVQAIDGAHAGSPFSAEHVLGPVPTLPSLYTLEAEPSVVRLVWYAATELPGAVTLYRRAGDAGWAALGPLASDGAGYLRYEDTAVEPGGRYGYRVGVASGTGQVFGEEVWADVPQATVAFALDRLAPNPSPDGTVNVRFSLPAGPAARLALLDVRGRRLVERMVQGPGRFAVTLGGDRRLGSGVYFVRLVQGAQERVERAIVLQ